VETHLSARVGHQARVSLIQIPYVHEYVGIYVSEPCSVCTESRHPV